MAKSSSSILPAKIALICGSSRTGSINHHLLKALQKRFKTAGAKTSEVKIEDYDLPLFQGDLDIPKGVSKFVRRLKGFDGVVMITPEYNGGLPPLLKNAIDWSSTLGTDHFTNPVYAIASCTPGPMSGIMGMRQLHYILTRVGADVVPVQTGVGLASQAFDAKGSLTAQPSSNLADKMISQVLTRIAQKRA